MANITLSVTNQRLTVSQLPIAAKSVQYLTAEVTYTTDDWDNRTVSAMFGQGDTTYQIAVEDGKITADKQLNLTAGDWLVWLVGVSEKVGDITPRITTNTCHLSVAPTGGTEGNPFPVIPPTQAEKIQAEIDELAAKTDSFAGDIATAKETATNAEKTAQAAETAANNASSKADSASGKADAAQATADSATTAAANAQAAADEAASKATTAQSKADSAATAASNAQSTADGANAAAAEAKATATAVDTKTGNLSELTTTDKSSLVAAINEAAKSGLPTVTTADDGKVLTVENGAWTAGEKPTYTAEEVGAIAQDDLQAATNAALAQAKASGEFDGAPGTPGENGITPNIQIGTVSTLDAGSDATATMTGTVENPLLNLGIPKGADGGGNGWRLANKVQATEISAAIESDVPQDAKSILIRIYQETEQKMLVQADGSDISQSKTVGVYWGQIADAPYPSAWFANIAPNGTNFRYQNVLFEFVDKPTNHVFQMQWESNRRDLGNNRITLNEIKTYPDVSIIADVHDYSHVFTTVQSPAYYNEGTCLEVWIK